MVTGLCNAVESLYASLDETLRFHEARASAEPAQVDEMPVDMEKDFRGVACPMNFVKTKMALSQLAAGQVLKVLLDDGEPAENVPASVETEGHRIVKKEKIGDYWAISIKKG